MPSPANYVEQGASASGVTPARLSLALGMVPKDDTILTCPARGTTVRRMERTGRFAPYDSAVHPRVDSRSPRTSLRVPPSEHVTFTSDPSSINQCRLTGAPKVGLPR